MHTLPKNDASVRPVHSPEVADIGDDFEFRTKLDQIHLINKQAASLPQFRQFRLRHSLFSSAPSFTSQLFSYFAYARREPEVIAFAGIQCSATVIAYLLAISVLGIVPSQFADDNILNFLSVVWFILCIGLAAIVIGVASGAIGASYFLRQRGIQSTFRRCLLMSVVRFVPLWQFAWLDGYVTVTQIMERLPKKRDPNDPAPSLASRILREVAYYAWKCVSVGMIPSILNGRSFSKSLKESFQLLRDNFKHVLLLRAGYSAYCWYVGIVAYLIALLFSIHVVPSWVFNDRLFGWHLFYLYAAIPISFAVAVVGIVLRPAFVLATCEFYSRQVGYTLNGITNSEYRKGKRQIAYASTSLILLLMLFYFLIDFYVDFRMGV